MTYFCKNIVEALNLDNAATGGQAEIARIPSNRPRKNPNISMVKAVLSADATSTAPADNWEVVAENVESAISAMEDVAQYVGPRSRNKIRYSLRRCYKRAKSIREIRGIEHIEDRSDQDHFVVNKCMLGRFISGEF